jgi:hypothetical protein
MANPPPSDLDELPPDSAIEKLYRADRRLRARDSWGALKPEDAASDAAYARGHAHGIEEAREEGLDMARTTLFAMLERKFGEVDESVMDKIGEADHVTLREYYLRVLDAPSADAIFA